MLLGEIVGVSTSYSEELFDFRFSTHLVVLTSWLATILASLFLSILSGSRATAEQQRWMWGPVVRGESSSDPDNPDDVSTDG